MSQCFVVGEGRADCQQLRLRQTEREKQLNRKGRKVFAKDAKNIWEEK